jgi:hypothetical protein
VVVQEQVVMPPTLRQRARGLELLLCVALIVPSIAACLRWVPALAVKARLAGVFLAMTTARTDSHERFASTGEWPAPSEPVPTGIEPTPRTAFTIAAAGAGLVARGTVGDDAQPFALSFVPAVSDGGANVRWLCGQHRAPAGWQAASAPRVLELPSGASYGICRDDGEVAL